MNKMTKDINKLKFPNGRLVSRVKQDAKEIGQAQHIDKQSALRQAAKNCGIDLPWRLALKKIVESQKQNSGVTISKVHQELLGVVLPVSNRVVRKSKQPKSSGKHTLVIDDKKVDLSWHLELNGQVYLMPASEAIMLKKLKNTPSGQPISVTKSEAVLNAARFSKLIGLKIIMNYNQQTHAIPLIKEYKQGESIKLNYEEEVLRFLEMYL